MKNFKTIIAALFAVIIFTGCEREDSVQPNSINEIETSDIKGVLKSKTTYSEFEYMGMAANINSISYSSGVYTISFYGSTPNHTISINSFDDEVLIDYDVTNTGTAITTNTEIDVTNEDIDIQTVGTFTFSAYETYSITSSDPVLKNIMPVFAVHKIMNGTSTASFDDNGTNDDFIPDDSASRKFWGKSTTREVATLDDGCPGGMGIRYYYDTYLFWVKTGSGIDDTCP